MSPLTVPQVADELGYAGSEDFLIGREGSLSPARRHAWAAARHRLGVEAAFFEGRLPVAYFRGLSQPSEHEVDEAIASLHRAVWCESRAQLLFVVLPAEVRVIDARLPPNPLAAPLAIGPVGSAQIEPFTRENLLRGRAAEFLAVTSARDSVVGSLRGDLRPALAGLVRDGLDRELASRLLARCLLARYLEARGFVVDPEPTMPVQEVLSTSLAATYRLFDSLHETFNGDVFAVSQTERRSVRRQHLGRVADLLSGTAPGQLTLFERYDFSAIPAETLGAVYEEFLRPVRRESGAYYTPGYLVEASLDQIEAASGFRPGSTVLDPACGSGLFLARAFLRLLDAAEGERGRPLTAPEMAQILSDQVFGCDLMEDALRIAALSCYLVLLDRLSSEGHTSEALEFPSLMSRNFTAGDFFDHLGSFAGPFDIIATNPPWSRATPATSRFLETAGRSFDANRPAAYGFFWACVDRLAPDGHMTMLMPAKSLYNKRTKQRLFQRQLYGESGLDAVIDLSAFRWQLFSDAVAPCSLFSVRGTEVKRQDHLTYCAPKQSPTSVATGRITIDGDRIVRIQRAQLVDQPWLLRNLVFGTLRDVELVGRLMRRGPTLKSLTQRGESWLAGLGYQTVDGGADEPLLRDIPHVAPEGISPSGAKLTDPIQHETFHRTRDTRIYDGPRVLVARSIEADQRVRSAYLSDPASFSERVLAIRNLSDDVQAVRALAAFLDSRVARYLLMMTASSWGVERPELKVADVLDLPVPFLAEESSRRELAAAWRSYDLEKGEEVDDLVASEFGLSTDDLALVDDRIDVQLRVLGNPLDPDLYRLPTDSELLSYARALGAALTPVAGWEPRVAAELEDESVVAKVFFDLSGEESSRGLVRRARPVVDALGDDIGTILVRRPIRIYGDRSVTIIKPAERRQLTVAAALQDADVVATELLRLAVRGREAAAA